MDQKLEIVKNYNYDKTVKSPKVEIEFFDDYNLQDLANDFEIAEFERRVSAPHVSKIVNSILNNTFRDNIFRVSRLANNKWKLIDGQHRLLALKKVYDEYGVETYNLILLVYQETDGRITYKGINQGKKLTAQDYLKALDNGKIEFFNKLREYVGAYSNYEQKSFLDILYSQHYTATKNPKGSYKDLEKILETILSKEIDQAVIFCKTINKVGGKISMNPIFRGSIYRNIYRISIEKKLTSIQIERLIKFLQKQKSIKELSEGRTEYFYNQVYDLILKNRKLWE